MVKCLVHFGVKGQKWGVRRNRQTSSDSGQSSGGNPKKLAKADKKWERGVTSRKTSLQVYNAAANRMNNGIIGAINKRFEGQDLNNPKNYAAYNKAYANAFSKVIGEEATRIMGSNPSGSKRVRADVDNDGRVLFSFEDIQHEEFAFFQVKLTRDSLGFITKVELLDEDEARMQSISVEEEHLSHFGVKGMRWGVMSKYKIHRLLGRGTRKEAQTGPYEKVGARNEREAAKRRAYGKKALEEDIAVMTERYKKGKMTQERYKKEIENLKTWWSKDVNATGRDVRREKRILGGAVAACTLAAIGFEVLGRSLG